MGESSQYHRQQHNRFVRTRYTAEGVVISCQDELGKTMFVVVVYVVVYVVDARVDWTNGSELSS
jgi:hypothetical protein